MEDTLIIYDNCEKPISPTLQDEGNINKIYIYVSDLTIQVNRNVGLPNEYQETPIRQITYKSK
jgi:hypothetical protein